MDYVILPPAAVTLIKISAKLTDMMDLFALETHRSMGAAPVWPLVCSKRTKPNLPPAATTHMAAAAVLCYEEQNLPQSAGSIRSSNPPPTRKVDSSGPAAHPQELPEGQKEEDGN